ncbi:MAG: hypothetical protein ACLTDR_07690 [Adlercreutzia equolifaciens]
MDAAGLKKAELVDAIYEAVCKAEGFTEVTGVLDIMGDGYGFLRTSGYLPGENDIYVGLATIRKNGLRKGDMVTGTTRPARPNDKFAALQKVSAVNDMAPRSWPYGRSSPTSRRCSPTSACSWSTGRTPPRPASSI